MNAYADKTQENKGQSVASTDFHKQSRNMPTFQFKDTRPEAIIQRKLQEIADNSPEVKQAAQLQALANLASAKQQPLVTKGNNTGLPDNLKSGIENLSGYSMDDVNVHYNSVKPAQLQAHAYAQGTDIHIAPGQEKHLPHEAWHVVQQKQGRVKPTMQMKGNINVNDDAGLEKEADVMGDKALQIRSNVNRSRALYSLSRGVVQRRVQVGKKNINERILNAAIIKGVKQGLIPLEYTMKVFNQEVVLNDAGKKASKKLLTFYTENTIHLNDFKSLTHQASQDLHMLANGNDNLIGIGHQHREFTYKRDSKDREKRIVNFESGLKKDNQRIYRTMTLNDWKNNYVSGHGGSIGQAMHYFNLGKKAHEQDEHRRPDLLVEFTFTGKNLNDLVSNIGANGEGEHSTSDSLGGKTEKNTAFGLSDNIFSVDLKNAAGLVSKDFVTAKVLASTNGALPEQTKKGKNIVWQKRPG